MGPVALRARLHRTRPSGRHTVLSVARQLRDRRDSDRHGRHAFVADETNGHWGNPLPLSGAGLKSSGSAGVDAIACCRQATASPAEPKPSAASNSYRPFAVTETGGHWGQAVAISTSKISIRRAGFAINSISCYSPGNCAAGGLYAYRRAESVYEQPLVISEIGGHWGRRCTYPA